MRRQLAAAAAGRQQQRVVGDALAIGELDPLRPAVDRGRGNA
jgi:hypothetical protein